MPYAHLNALRKKHEAIERRIREEMLHPSRDELRLRKMKSERLHLREEIERERR